MVKYVSLASLTRTVLVQNEDTTCVQITPVIHPEKIVLLLKKVYNNFVCVNPYLCVSPRLLQEYFSVYSSKKQDKC
jgi:hypothetical protein